jgi:hypothetical protein
LKIAIDPRLVAAAVLLCVAGFASADCPPAGMTKATLEALKAADWKVADDARRQSVALELLDCLGAPDPSLRDDLAFEAISHWARAKHAER